MRLLIVGAAPMVVPLPVRWSLLAIGVSLLVSSPEPAREPSSVVPAAA